MRAGIYVLRTVSDSRTGRVYRYFTVLPADEPAARAARVIAGEVEREARRQSFSFGGLHGYLATSQFEAHATPQERKLVEEQRRRKP